jgi:nucleotide-binding universal stress UspA family protein
MFRSILLPLAEGPAAAVARDHALWLAKKEGSGIHALVVIDIKAFEIPVMGTPDGFMPSVVTPPIQESQTVLEELNAQARERLEVFSKECAAKNVSCSVDIRTGIPAEVVAREAVAHDVVVLSRLGYSQGANAEARLDPLVPPVLRGSIRPVLVAGIKLPESGDVRSILVAYDGSVHAGRALLVAAELGARPGVTCHLVNIAPTQDLGEETIAQAEAFLYHHGVAPQKQIVIGSKPSELICGLVNKLGADLLIMGAYGHGPIREMLFGSTTERVLSHCGSSVILQS